MARYIDEIIQPGETVLYSTNAHWIFYVPAIVFWMVAFALAGSSFLVEPGPARIFLLSAAAVAGVIALVATLRAWFHRFTTETDVTNRRVVHKKGFIRRKTFEMSLDKVESVDVDQTIAGRIFGYGDVTVRGVGEGFETLRTIAAPLVFRTAITGRDPVQP